eukprot:jgi/Undpi1/9936/HiC_scaffold_28.g12390.m1
MAEYRRIARTAAVVLSLSHGATSFVAYTSAVLLRLQTPPSVASLRQQRTKSYSHSNRRSDTRHDVFRTRAGIGEFLLPPQDISTEIIVGEVDTEVTFDEFNRSLLKGEVKKCEFYGPNFDKAVVQLKDGTKALIGKGYPEERAFSDDSPMKVVGLLRNAGVPYTTQFKMTAYSKPKSYKSVETLEAENRQRNEDQAMERLMSE